MRIGRLLSVANTCRRRGRDSRAGAIPTPNYGESFLCSNLKANKSILAQELILLKRIMIHNLKVLGLDPALADSGDAEFVLRNAGAISLSGMAFLRLFQGNRVNELLLRRLVCVSRARGWHMPAQMQFFL